MAREPKPPVKRVKVAVGLRVVYEGRAYSDGAIAEVPAAVADEWLRQMWVTEE